MRLAVTGQIAALQRQELINPCLDTVYVFIRIGMKRLQLRVEGFTGIKILYAQPGRTVQLHRHLIDIIRMMKGRHHRKPEFVGHPPFTQQ